MIQIVDQGTFGDLDYEPRQRESGSFGSFADQSRQTGASQLHGGDIHRKRERRGYGTSFCKRLAQELQRQGVDPTLFLCKRDELIRRNEAVLGMLPPRQDFESGQLAGAQRDNRLEVGNELALAKSVLCARCSAVSDKLGGFLAGFHGFSSPFRSAGLAQSGVDWRNKDRANL